MPVPTFTGQSQHVIDAKSRLAIPAKFRAELDAQRDGARWVCSPVTGALRLYPKATFDELAARLAQSLVPTDDQIRRNEAVFGNSEQLEMDGQGRIAIPRYQIELAELPSPEVVVVGMFDHLEVRDRSAWVAGQAERIRSLGTLAAKLEARERERG